MYKYRRNVAVFVLDNAGRILICERVDIPGAWQLPQGGIEEGESSEDAMFRELYEEIGTRMVEILGRLPKAICYEWPEDFWAKGFRGQEQEYFLVRMKEGATIDLLGCSDYPEFRAYRWVDAEDFCQVVSGFKREAYLQAIAELQVLYPGLIANPEPSN